MDYRPARTITIGWLLGFTFANAAAADPTIPHLDHVAIVVMENHSYDQARAWPFVSTLAASATVCANSYGVTHPSQPNYLALWSASTQGVTNDTCPPRRAPYSAPNLGQACEAAGLSWAAYSENLPAPAYSGCFNDIELYARKHSPWADFTNIDHQRELPFADLAAAESLGTLPNLAFVIPNQCNNGHDCGPAVADAWLASHLPKLVEAVGSHGLVVLTWDEDDASATNHILTVLLGPRVKAGYTCAQYLTHYDLVRTVCEALRIAPMGAATTATPVQDCWVLAVADAATPPQPDWLGEPSPNPSRGLTTALLRLPREYPVQAAIYDLAGRRVRSFETGVQSGDVRLVWDGRRDDGSPVRRGVYILRVRAGSTELRRKLIRSGSVPQ